MHKKVQLLVLAGMISANALSSTTAVLADNNLKTAKDAKMERIIVEDTVAPTPKEEWDYTVKNNVAVINGYIGSSEKVVIPREIDGMPVELENLDSSMFPNVKHISVAEGSTKIKLRTNSLRDAFKNNTDLVSVNLQGVDTEELTDLNGTFSGCTSLTSVDFNDWTVDNVTDFGDMFNGTKKLKFLDLTDWEVDKSDKITGMFRIDSNSSVEEKTILVVTNSSRLSQYTIYESQNRYPSMVSFNANGGCFLGNNDILNMAVPRYTVDSYDLNHLEDIIENDIIFAGKPSREGYEFKGWYAETTPTNLYEFFNMIYKAKWVQEGTNAELEEGTGERRNPYVVRIYNETGLNNLLDWLKNKEINMDFYRYGEPTVKDGIATYVLHVFDKKSGAVSYFNIKVNNSNSVLTEKLNEIRLFEVKDLEHLNGDSGDDSPFELRVNTIKGLNQLLDSLNSDEYIGYYRTEEPVSEDRYDIRYEICAVTKEGKTIHIFVTVDNLEAEIMNKIESITTEEPALPEQPPVDTPEDDEDSDVNYDDEITTLPDDVPVEDAKPELPEQPEVDTSEKPENKPEGDITPEFNHDVVELVKGDGQKDNPFELSVKEVEVNKLTNFLDELKGLNPVVESVTKEGNYTLYKIKVNKISRSSENSVYITLKVENTQTGIIDILNDFAKEYYPIVEDEVVLDSISKEKMTVPVTNNTSTDNVKTGDVSLGGHILLGASALLGLLKNRRKRK